MRIGGVFLLEPISPADWDSVAHFWLLFLSGRSGAPWSLLPCSCGRHTAPPAQKSKPTPASGISALHAVWAFLNHTLMGGGLIFLQKYPIMEINFIREDYL